MNMKKRILSIWVLGLILQSGFAQLTQAPGVITGKIRMNKPSITAASRSASNPTTCGSDTSLFPNLSSTGYGSLLIGNGQFFGQFYAAPQDITVSGFRFYSYLPYDTLSKRKKVTVACKLFEAGGDSLPTGSALAVGYTTIDTVLGSLTLARLTRNVEFNKPVTVSKNYVLVVEYDSSTTRPAVVTNSWNNGDGEGRNLSCASISGKWYRGLALNVNGVPFDCHAQFYPFVSYKYGTDFTINKDCYTTLDTIRFNNTFRSNIGGSVFYNQYMYYEYAGFHEYCHNWAFDNGSNFMYSTIDGKFRPKTKKNFNVELSSMLVTYSNSNGNCFDTTRKTVYFKPSTPVLISTSNGCIGDSLQLKVSPVTDVIVSWAPQGINKPAFHVGNSYTIAKVQKPDSMMLKATNGSCISGNLNVYTTANKYPTVLTAKNDSLCSGASANLTASTDYGVINWYTKLNGGNKVFTGNTYVTSVLNSDTTLYAEANNNGCLYKGGRAEVKALVGSDFAPSKPTGFSDTSLCLKSSSITLDLSATPSANASLRWFDVSTGGSPLYTGNKYTYTVNSRGTKTLYVESWNGNCGSGRFPININANQHPSTFAKVGDEICLGDSADIAASTQWGSVNWFLSKSDSKPYSNSKFIRMGGFANKNSFAYFKTSEGDCFNPNWDSVAITVNIPPTATSVLAPSVCFKSIGEITVNVPYGSVNWFVDENATSPVKTGNKYNLGIMFSDATMYYNTEEKGCTSEKQKVSVKTLVRPTAGFQWTLDYPRKVTCTPINTTDMTIQWVWGDGNTTTGNTGTHQYASEGTYNVLMIATSKTSGCKDTADIQVVVDHLSVNKSNKRIVNVFPNPVNQNATLQIQGFQSATIQWFDLSGRMIHQTTLENGITSVPAGITPGIYTLKGKSGQQEFHSKVQIID